MNTFFVLSRGEKLPVTRPEDIIPYLAAQEYHWREGFSAYELSYRWFEARGFPPTVSAVLDQSEIVQGARFTEGFFEYQVNLKTPGRPSQSDLMVFAETAGGTVAVAVEGKVGEGFGCSVGKWNTTDGRDWRIRSLCDDFSLFYDDVVDVKYQLVHRTASALYEAQRRGLPRAIMLVHSFDAWDSHFRDFSKFSCCLDCPVNAPGQMSRFKRFGEVEVALGWVSDVPRAMRVSEVSARDVSAACNLSPDGE